LFLWSSQYQDVVWLDSNSYSASHSSYDAILAVNAFTAIKTDYSHALKTLDDYIETTKDWIFGYISYDLKNGIENLSSTNHDRLAFPDLYFFQPQKLFFIKGTTIEMQYLNVVSDEIQDDIKDIKSYNRKEFASVSDLNIQSKISKQTYLDKIENIISHLKRGDIYEMNFCQEFFIEEHSNFDAVKCFMDLNDISKPPFACFFRHEHLHAVGASPERFIKKEGQKIISQPIKGTAKRHQNEDIDNILKNELSQNPKEVSENVMIVDLVRNDLSKIAKKNTVNVDELCKIYTFEQVHHMISTVSVELETEVKMSDILRATFPMGSMTGAPKISAMQIAEDLESTKRGLYSGCIGYISPDFNFDFNVVIRSILHNSKTNYTSMMVGSAITIKSEPEKEYEECLIKAKALFEVLNKSIKAVEKL
jgi:para-aminobenzoate synthetase component 1